MLLRAQNDGSIDGIAATMLAESTDHAPLAFGVSVITNALAFPHELGHIMGLRHDRYDACEHDTTNPECPSEVVQPYAYGYVNQKAFEDGAATSTRWRTIMSVNFQCRDDGFNCTALNRFSNPNQTYRGDSLGVALTESNRASTAVDGPADAVRALNDTRDTVAEFREGRARKVSFGAASYSVTEGGTVTVTVQLDVAPERGLNLPILLTATSTDGAWPGDYTNTIPASVTFGEGETEKTFTVGAVDDTRQENTETLTLGFGTRLPMGVAIGSPATATVTLTDNDPATTDAPSVSTVALISNPGVAYAAGEKIAVAVVFTKPITVTDTPQLALTVGTTTRQAQCQNAASEVLTCTYTVVADESDTDGVSIAANALTLPSGVTITDADDRGATITHTAVAANSSHIVDGITPDLQTATADGPTLRLTYDEALDETSVPALSRFTVTVGGAAQPVTLVRVAGRVVTLTLDTRVNPSSVVRLDYDQQTPRIQDRAGNPAAALSQQVVETPRPVYDTDDDGLIEITTLAQLDAMRHDLDGDGSPTAVGATAHTAAFSEVKVRLVCGASSNWMCHGYELMADLDFFDTNMDGQVDMDDDTNGDDRVDAQDNMAYWNNGAGWNPIGGIAGFETNFYGNGYTIANLFIERTGDAVGLFGNIGSRGVIQRVSLVRVQISGGSSGAGSLAGRNEGTISASYATGRVTGNSRVGGLVGQNEGEITASYATGRVTGTTEVGGLVGQNGNRVRITASYATGRVTGTTEVGGLVGQNEGEITASYATGRVTGTTNVGGMVGRNSGRVTITNSYWDTATSGQASSAGGTAQTTTALQTPTGYTAGSIYADWNVDLDGDMTADDPWHFGTASQYPALDVDFDGDGTASWEEFGSQLRTGPTSLTVATDTGLVVLSWTAVSIGSTWDPAPAVTYTVYRTTGSTVETVAEDLTASPYTDRTVTRGTMYTYQIAAVVNGGEATRGGRSTEVTGPNRPPVFDEDDGAERIIAENTVAGQDIGTPVTATDPEDDGLTYSLGGTDAAAFTLDTATGQLQTKRALDYETKSSYAVTITVRDGKDVDDERDAMDEDASIAVTITVTDVNDPPVFTVPPASRIIVENTPVGQALGSPFTATDDDNDSLTYRLDPASETIFTIDKQTGQIQTKAALDHETQPRYAVIVQVSDGKDAGGNPDLSTDTFLPVTVTVTDAPGWVDLPSTAPRVGTPFTATVRDPDGVEEVTEWCWARSFLSTFPDTPEHPTTELSCTTSDLTTMATYTPVTEDVNHYLRITATYNDGDGTNNKDARRVSEAAVSDPAGPRPPGGGGSGGGGGGGGPACAEDLHGNSAAQATAIALATATAGALCPATDVDYLTVTAPGRGLLFVETTGSVNTRGTIWQDGVPLASGPTRGSEQDARLGARVQAGPVVIALQGQGGATGDYDLVVTFVQGYLENPGTESFQSGVGVLSGWVCAAERVEIELNGVAQPAAYGTERRDTEEVCGDTDNGFGLLFNWNLLGEGEHDVVAFVDGVELGRATVTVTTLGAEFLRGAEGECEVEDFPTPGEMVTLVWQQNSQNFVIASDPASTGERRVGSLDMGFLENPGPYSFQSGIGVISGWVCAAEAVAIEIGHLGQQFAAYGTERRDTEEVCGDTDNGFGLLFNWNLLGDGEHEVIAYVNDGELGRATVRVMTLGEEFLRGADGECVVNDFPTPGETVTLEWQQNQQNFVIVGRE